MADIVYDLDYVVEGDIIALMLCIIVNALIRSTYTVKKENFGLFRSGNRLVGFAAGCSITYHSLMAYLTEELVLFVYLYRAATYCSLIWTYICFCTYVKNLVNMSPKYQKIFNISIYGVGGVFTLLQFAGPFLKWGFYIDENLVIHQNYYTEFFRYFYVYYTLSLAVIFIAYRKQFIGKVVNCLRTVMIISFGLMCFQAEFMETSYTVVTFAFPIMVALFLFHYNSYDVATGTMDQYAFRQYVKEMLEKDKKFSMIFLSLPGITTDKLRKLSKDLLKRNDQFFVKSCCFRLQDNRVVLVYQKEKNQNFDDRNTVLYNEFMRVRDNSDFYIVMMDEVFMI